jgi:hypothetical protein
LDGTLVVPSGVELRGVFDVAHHTMDVFHPLPGEGRGIRGSELFTTHGKGDPETTPFIRLQAGSSIRGITIYHPEQTWSHYEASGSFVPYPWALQALGRDVCLKDVTLVNAWKGADFGTHDTTGHRIDFLCGTVLRQGLYLDRSKGGAIKNVHWNGTYWSHSNYPDRPATREGQHGWALIRDAAQKTLVGFEVGAVENESTLHTFVFGSDVGQKLVRGAGSGATGTFMMHGTDESRVSLQVDDVLDAQLVNYQLVSMAAGSPRHYLEIGTNVQGRAAFDNLLMWGYMPGPDTGIKMSSGNIFIRQCNLMNHGTEMGILQAGGDLTMVNARFRFGINAEVGAYPQGLYGRFLPTIGSARLVGLVKRGNTPDGQVFDNRAGDRFQASGSLWQ